MCMVISKELGFRKVCVALACSLRSLTRSGSESTCFISMRTVHGVKMAATLGNVEEIRNRVILGEFGVKNVSLSRNNNRNESNI